VEPCHLLGTELSSPTSLCPARLSASVSLSSWVTSLSPGWPGPVWPVCPCGLGLHLQPGLGPAAEAPLPAPRLSVPQSAADAPSSPGVPYDSLPGTQSPGMEGASESPPSPKHTLQKGTGDQREQSPAQGHRPHSQHPSPTAQCGQWPSGRFFRNFPAPLPLPLTSRSGLNPTIKNVRYLQ
jgi:hypothetical protein